MGTDSNRVGVGRFAPSPSGDLHIGNLRTAILAWIWAKRSGRDFVIRVEDIDRVKLGAAEHQLADLARIGLDWCSPVLFQSSRDEAHRQALAKLEATGLVFECFCSRKDIAAASQAPHARPGCYPGTCLGLSQAEREAKRQALAADGRMPALRLLPAVKTWQVVDFFAGQVIEPIDYPVLRRSDGKIAYNLAVVVDDAFQQVDQVVRADDLLFSAPTQSYLASVLGFAQAEYVHVPLVVNQNMDRLAKRDGAVTLTQLIDAGWSVGDVVSQIGASLGITNPGRTVTELAGQFDPALMPREPWIFTPPAPPTKG